MGNRRCNPVLTFEAVRCFMLAMSDARQSIAG